MNVIRSLSLLILVGCGIGTLPTPLLPMFTVAVEESLARFRANRMSATSVDSTDSEELPVANPSPSTIHQELGIQNAQQVPQAPQTPVNPTVPPSLWQSLTTFVNNHPYITASFGIGILACGALLYYGWKRHVRKKTESRNALMHHDCLSDSISFNGKTLKGAEYNKGDIRIIQLPVALQHGLSCGYHSLKNGILIAQTLLNQGNFDALSDTQLEETLFGYPAIKYYYFKTNGGPWRAHVKKAFESKPNHHSSVIDDISSDALESLITYEKQRHCLLKKDIDIFAIDDVRIIGAPINVEQVGDFNKRDNLVSPDYVIPSVIEHMHQAQAEGKSYAAVFLLNTGHEYNNNGQLGGAGSHWYTVVLWVENNKHTYFVTDSVSAVRIPQGRGSADARLARLINTIEQQTLLREV